MSTSKPRPPPSPINPLPVELLTRLCGLLSARTETSSLLAIMRTSAQLYDVVSPLIHATARLNRDNVKAFFRGLVTVVTTIRHPDKTSGWKEQPPQIHTDAYQPDSASEKRKICLLGLVKRMNLDSSLSDSYHASHTIDFGRLSSHAKGGSVPFLTWVLGSATTYVERLFPSLRLTTYVELLDDEDDYDTDSSESEVDHQHSQFRITIRIRPVASIPKDHNDEGPYTKEQWDICIRTDSLSDLGFYPDQSLYGCRTLRSWLYDINYDDQVAIRHLSIHSEAEILLDGINALRLRGALRVYIRRSTSWPAERLSSNRADAIARRKAVEECADLFKCLLRADEYTNDDDYTIKVYHASFRQKADVDLPRQLVFEALRASLDPESVTMTEISGSAAQILALETFGSCRRELRLAGRGDKVAACICGRTRTRGGKGKAK